MKTKEEIELLMESAKREYERSKLDAAGHVYDVCAWILEAKPETLFDSMVVKQRTINKLEKQLKEYNERLSN
jgi:hypothetical protein